MTTELEAQVYLIVVGNHVKKIVFDEIFAEPSRDAAEEIYKFPAEIVPAKAVIKTDQPYIMATT